MPKAAKPLDFERSLEELERIVKQMEDGELSLEESLKTFERGMELSRACQKALDEAEQRVWVVDPLDKTVGVRSIKLTGSTKDGFRGVAAGVRANEMVVVHADGELEDGLRVKEISK